MPKAPKQLSPAKSSSPGKGKENPGTRNVLSTYSKPFPKINAIGTKSPAQRSSGRVSKPILPVTPVKTNQTESDANEVNNIH